MTETEPPEYVAERLHDAIATEPDVYELGIVVRVTGNTVTLSGPASSAAQRDAVGDLVGRLAPELDLVNDIEVPSTEPPRRVEQL
jgi:osmotically-inducible protein OsmY